MHHSHTQSRTADGQWFWLWDAGNGSKRAVAQQGEEPCWHSVWHHHPSTLEPPQPLALYQRSQLYIVESNQGDPAPPDSFSQMEQLEKDSSLRNWLTFFDAFSCLALYLSFKQFVRNQTTPKQPISSKIRAQTKQERLPFPALPFCSCWSEAV